MENMMIKAGEGWGKPCNRLWDVKYVKYKILDKIVIVFETFEGT